MGEARDDDRPDLSDGPAAPGGPAGQLVKRSVAISGHATSVSLERLFWDGLTAIARRHGRSVAALVAAIDAGRTGNLSSALRTYILADALARAEGKEGLPWPRSST